MSPGVSRTFGGPFLCRTHLAVLAVYVTRGEQQAKGIILSRTTFLIDSELIGCYFMTPIGVGPYIKGCALYTDA